MKPPKKSIEDRNKWMYNRGVKEMMQFTGRGMIKIIFIEKNEMNMIKNSIFYK